MKESTLEEAHPLTVDFQTQTSVVPSDLPDPRDMQVVRDRLPRIRRNVAFAKRVAHQRQHVAKRRQTARLLVEAGLSESC
jgi:hypothetical protein